VLHWTALMNYAVQ